MHVGRNAPIVNNTKWSSSTNTTHLVQLAHYDHATSVISQDTYTNLYGTSSQNAQAYYDARRLKLLIYSPKAKYRISCAREALETAAEALEKAGIWLDFEDMSKTSDVRFAIHAIQASLAGLALLDTMLEDLL